ncbi:hypothetical protein BDQ12DRAFT_361610 [Crucibulum laeve]|uniref:Uncharacterized protein n=1 Tax=Crucibulum laeve TaxID=68775 RepID=A0A5C3LQT7_9AGAR|nr:hypothetical protein BDQ12DRAFT_361610 [Crucibulum laeve]
MFHPFEGFDLGPASGSGSTSTSSASGSGSGSASTGAQRPYLGVDDESLQRQQQNYEEEDEESDDMNTMEPDDPDQDDQEDDEEEEEQEEEEDEDEDEDAETYYSFAEDVELPGMDLDLGLGLGLGQTIIGGEEAAGGVVVSEEEEEEDEDEEVIVFTGSGAERNRAGGEEEEEAGDEQHEDDDEENDGEGEEQTPTTALQADYAGFRERLDSALERLRSPSPLVPEFAGSVSGGVGGSSGGLHRLPTPSIPSPPLEFAYRSQLPTLPIPPSHLELAHASRSRARPTPTIPPPRLELAYGSRRGAGPAPSSSNGFGSSSANEFNYGFNGSFSGRLSGSGSSSFNESGSTSSNSNTHIPSFGTALREIQREDTRERETAQFLAALFGAATEEAEGDRGEEERRSDGGGRLNEHARPFSSLSGTHETDVPATNHQGSQAYLNRNETLAQRTTRARISNAATLNDNASLMASIERQVSQATAVLSAQARAARAPDSGYRHLPAPRMRPPPSDGGWNAYSDMAERRRNEARQRELARAIVRERERQREGERGREAEMQSQREAEMQNQRERARNLPMSFNLRESENSVPARRNFFDPTPVPGSLVRRMQTGLSSTNSTSTSASASASASGVNPGATQPQIQRRVISADQRAALMAGAWDDSRITVTRIADGSGTSRAPSGPPTLPPLAMDSISSDDEYDGWIRDLELRRRSRAVARLSADADASVTRNTERGPNSGDGSMHGGINATDNNASMVSAGSSTNSGTSTNPPATFSSSSSSVPIRVDHTPPSPLLTELHQLLAPSSSSATTTTTTNVNNASSNSFTPTHRATSHDMSYFPIPRSNPPQINPNSFSWEREPPVDRAFQAILNYEGNGTFTVTPMEIESPPPPPQQQQSQSQPRPQVQPQQQRARPTMPRTQTSSEWTRIGNEWGPVGSFGRAEEENQVQSDRDQTVANSQSNDCTFLLTLKACSVFY